MLTRRSLIGSLLAAPAIIRTPGLLMPVSTSLIVRPKDTYWASKTHASWASKTPDEILADVNKALTDTWGQQQVTIAPWQVYWCAATNATDFGSYEVDFSDAELARKLVRDKSYRAT